VHNLKLSDIEEKGVWKKYDAYRLKVKEAEKKFT